VAIAGAWWVFAPQAGPWPLVIALLHWGIWLAAGKFPIRRTALDIPLILFLLTAGVGVWAAYDRTAAWNKFWLITAGVLLYYALAGQPHSNWQMVFGLAGVLGAGVSIYFLLTQNWAQFPADLNLLNRLGLAWMDIRPTLNGPWIHPNIAGGLLAMLLPVSLAVWVDAWGKHSRNLHLAAAGLSGVIAIGLLMTSSRAAWLALAAGFGIWGWWQVSGLAARRLSWNRVLAFGIPVLLAIFLALGAFKLHSGSLIQAANTMPGEANAGSRVEITRDTLQLIRDYPFTGGGLASFPGLYSTYIRVIMVPIFFYSHNLYTDIALEQGLPGLVAFLLILAGTCWKLLGSLTSRPTHNYLAGACLVGLTVVVLHGLADDALYGMGGTPLIFLMSGLVFSMQTMAPERIQEPKYGLIDQQKKPITAHGWLYASALILLGLGGIGLVFAKPLASAWYANLGAVAMARIQLGEQPDSFDEILAIQGQLKSVLTPLNRALAQNPDNFTAIYRLGIYSYYGNDFEKARDYFESAYIQDRSHRGVQKLLGYAYTWGGDLTKAQALLGNIPEAGEEMDAYTWWWATQHREDLSLLAQQLATRLRDTSK
jgi:putative inorganic carbon (HCO3(-)) transporter